MGLVLKEIEEIVNSEKNAGEFAELIRAFKKLGIEKYDYFVADGFYRYYDEDSVIDSQMNGRPQVVAAKASLTAIKHAVLKAQSGKITFEEFTELAGASGVLYWSADLVEMKVEYIDQSGNILLSEPIPEG
ncbi:DUF1398 family protein [Enterococcus termitis]|jgi:uncharacterized protein YbcV (DUF1398 family)|uniref:Envelope protein n=1 Tax=Enterococcus termitis TaxID=332950 RepID=A0A1E5H6M3_9ENTE|nr:DUF1398 family protein [Enterococcus termitis]OEG20563.1 envelope protein [Enterococcus termitis]OJG99877.1 hypothetical protein RV18_GL000216 [Enterococcus termitis]